MVRAQLEALASDLPPAALKSGMLATAGTARLLSNTIGRYAWRDYVLDPVMVASSGARLLAREAEAVIRDDLLPLAALATHNLDEAEILVEATVREPSAMERAGRDLLARGARAALIKGGHLAGDTITDVLVTARGVRRFTHPKVLTTSTHGTG
jgi:hydroxymethylpyrimidine/phosphomethylpyrimidine kinase